MPTTDFLEAWSEIGQKDADPKIDLYIAFGKDPQMHGTVGLAWTGGACKDYHKTSFNEYRRTPAQTAMVYIMKMNLTKLSKYYWLDILM